MSKCLCSMNESSIKVLKAFSFWERMGGGGVSEGRTLTPEVGSHRRGSKTMPKTDCTRAFALCHIAVDHLDEETSEGGA